MFLLTSTLLRSCWQCCGLSLVCVCYLSSFLVQRARTCALFATLSVGYRTLVFVDPAFHLSLNKNWFLTRDCLLISFHLIPSFLDFLAGYVFLVKTLLDDVCPWIPGLGRSQSIGPTSGWHFLPNLLWFLRLSFLLTVTMNLRLLFRHLLNLFGSTFLIAFSWQFVSCFNLQDNWIVWENVDMKRY